MSRVTIGIPAYNDSDYVRMLLDTIRWYTFYEDYRIAVVDDGSPDIAVRDSVAVLCEKYNATFIQHEDNKGVSASWNTLCNNAIDSGSEIMVLLNSDILVCPQWLRCAMFALDANKCTDRVGSFFWEPVSIPLTMIREQMEIMHRQFWSHAYLFPSTKEPSNTRYAGVSHNPMEAQDAMQWGVGRVQSPNGTGFTFFLDTYKKVGEFDEHMKSFHEESDFGVRCTQLGMASYGLPFPRTYHGCSRTFSENQDTVNANVRFLQSRKRFIEKFEVPNEFHDGRYFEYVHNKYMQHIEKVELRFIVPASDGSKMNVPTPMKDCTVSIPKLAEVAAIL